VKAENLRFDREGWVEYWDASGRIYRFPLDRMVEIIVRFGEYAGTARQRRDPGVPDDCDLPADPHADKIGADDIIDGHFACQSIQSVNDFVEQVLEARRLNKGRGASRPSGGPPRQQRGQEDRNFS